MRSVRHRRGSVLLMAIGLLTIVAILASTFLIVSDLDAREAEILAVKGQADPTAHGILADILDWIGSDRHANEDGPYGESEDDDDGWLDYMDMPYHQDDDDFVDRWLAEDCQAGPIISGHMSNINVGEDHDEDPGHPDHYNGRSFNENSGNDQDYVDTDGDDIQDAYLFDRLIRDTKGKTFWAAVRIVDLTGRICINTAGGRYAETDEARLPSSRSPAMVDLYNYVTPQAYAKIHEARLGTMPPADAQYASLKGYDAYCGRRMLWPAHGDNEQQAYLPFGIGDEMFLLWCKRFDENPVTNAGRLFDVINDAQVTYFGDEVKRHLTTISGAGAVVRHPDADGDTDFSTLTHLDVRTETGRNAIYERMHRMLTELDLAEDDVEARRMAAHFTANLWAYQANGMTGDPWKFDPPDETYAVFGLRPELVITEVFAGHKPSSGPDPNQDDHAWGYAIEISNPTKRSINLAEYKLIIKGTETHEVVLSGALAGRTQGQDYPSKKVIYSFGFGPKHQDANDNLDQAKKTFFGVTDIGDWLEDEELDFSGGGDIVIDLVRPTGNDIVPVDQVTTDDDNLDYQLDSKESLSQGTGSEVYKILRRDDRLQDGQTRLARYNLAVYEPWEDDEPPASSKLGIGNDISSERDLQRPAEYEKPEYSVDIYRPRELADPDPDAEYYQMKSIGETCNVYFAGPIVFDDGSRGVFTRRVLRNDASGVFKDKHHRGRLAFHPDRINDDGYGPDRYPDVPAGTLIGEFFTHVKTHDFRAEERPRIYGQINANTAARQVLLRLPWPDPNATDLGLDGATVSFEPAVAVEHIVRYRARQDYGSHSYSDRGHRDVIRDLRDDSDIDGYVTPGEIAVPMAEYMEDLLGANDEHADYNRALNALYAYVADCLTNRSDVFAAYIMVKYGKTKVSPGYSWNYVAVIDRSNVVGKDDVPAVLMFAQVK